MGLGKGRSRASSLDRVLCLRFSRVLRATTTSIRTSTSMMAHVRAKLDEWRVPACD
jgi:hypothetical protein